MAGVAVTATQRAPATRLRRTPQPPACCLDAGTTARADNAVAPASAGLKPLRRRAALAGGAAALTAALAAQPARALQLPSAAALFQAQPEASQLVVDPAFASLVRAI